MFAKFFGKDGNGIIRSARFLRVPLPAGGECAFNVSDIIAVTPYGSGDLSTIIYRVTNNRFERQIVKAESERLCDCLDELTF